MQTASVRRARRAGRPRRVGVARHPNGSVHRHATKATEAETLSAVCGARVRHGLAISLTDARDPRIATPLGRLFRSGTITKREYDAGELYAASFRRAASLLGIPAPYPRCPDAAKGTRPEISKDDAEDIKQKFWEANGALGNAGRAAWREVREVTVMLNDSSETASLRFGLRALAIHYKLPVDAEEEAA